MTEAGEKWVQEVCVKSGVDKSFIGHFDCCDVEHWIRAFCAEVEKRAKLMEDPTEAAMPHGEGINHVNDCFVEAFHELKAELLGGDNAS